MNPSVITLLARAVILLAGTVPEQPPADWMLVGGDQIVWAIRTPSGDQATAGVLELNYCPRTGTPLPFRPLPIGAFRGTMRRSAAVDNTLEVFFEGGAHYRFRVPVKGESARTWSPELRLANNAIPLILAGDEQVHCLFAIVSRASADALKTQPTPTPKANKPDISNNTDNANKADDAPGDSTKTDNSNGTDTGDQQPGDQQAGNDKPQATPGAVVTPVDSGETSLIRYANRTWTHVADLPVNLRDHRPLGMLARNNTVWLILAGTGPDEPANWLTWDARTWSDPQPVAQVRTDQIVRVVLLDKTPVILVRDESNPSSSLTPWTLGGGGWKRNKPLTVNGVPLDQPAEKLRIDRFGSQIIVAWRTPASQVMAGLWPATGGEPSAAPQPVAVLSVSPVAPESEQLRVMISAIVLVAILSVVFARRRDSFLVDLPRPPGYQLASFHRRFIAFVIDLFLVGLAAYPLILAPWFDANIDLTADFAEQIEQMKVAMITQPQAFYWRWLAGAMVFVIYGAVCESVFSATCGKLLMGLRVCNDQGKPCSIGAAIARNLLRLIELYPAMQFAPTVIFVLMTRNRQRIGDLIARTIVVERSSAPTPTTSPHRPMDDQEDPATNPPSDPDGDPPIDSGPTPNGEPPRTEPPPDHGPSNDDRPPDNRPSNGDR